MKDVDRDIVCLCVHVLINLFLLFTCYYCFSIISVMSLSLYYLPTLGCQHPIAVTTISGSKPYKCGYHTSAVVDHESY